MTLSVNTAFTIDANGDSPISVARINSTQSIALYLDGSASDILAKVVEVDEGLGSAETLEATPNTGSSKAAVAVLSETKAIAVWTQQGGNCEVAIITISGTSLSLEVASIINPTNASENSGSFAFAVLSSAAVILIFDDMGTSYANYLTISVNTITDEDSVNFESGVSNVSAVPLSTITAIAAYTDSSDVFAMCVFQITAGPTITAGTPVNVESTDTGSGGENGDTALAQISSSRALLAYANHTDEILKAVVISISGTTPSANTPANVDTWNSGAGEALRSLALVDFSATQMGLSYNESSGGVSSIAELTVSGTNVTDQGSISLTADDTTGSRAAMFSSTKGIVVYSGSAKGVIVTASPISVDELDIAPMRKPADIDADGTYVYIAALNNSGNPVLIKILGDLSADGDIVFNPGAGSDIGVECGNFNADIVWIAGAFGGTNVVEKTEDGGTNFVVKDDGTFGSVTTFAVGPDSDKRILIVDGNEDIHETIDDGDTWTTYQTAVGLTTISVARLDKNAQEIALGNEASANINIQYSVNTGANLQDYSDGFPEINVTGLEVG